MTDPTQTAYRAEQITKIVIYAALALIGFYFTFRKKK
jgi:hypothetical protein